MTDLAVALVIKEVFVLHALVQQDYTEAQLIQLELLSLPPIKKRRHS